MLGVVTPAIAAPPGAQVPVPRPPMPMARPPIATLPAAAALPAKPPAAPPKKVVRRAPPRPEPPPLPPPSLKLTITAPAPTAPAWTMRIENLDAVPVRIVADARLLSFEVTPPEGKAVRCTLPSDMRPSDDLDRGLVLPPKRAYREGLDPRMYCFGARELAALVPGATVVAHYGWPAGRRTAGPHVVSAIDGIEPKVGGTAEVVSETATLPQATSATAPGASGSAATAPSVISGATPIAGAELSPAATPSGAPQAAAGEDGDTPPKLTLSVPARIDVERPQNLSIPVKLTNAGPRAVTLLYRAQTLGFDVDGPGGPRRCRWPSDVGAPIREVFTRVGARGHASVDVLLEDLCPDETFDQAGLYTIVPRLDTRKASGKAIGMRTFDGEVQGETPLLLRVRKPASPALAARPRLE